MSYVVSPRTRYVCMNCAPKATFDTEEELKDHFLKIHGRVPVEWVPDRERLRTPPSGRIY